MKLWKLSCECVITFVQSTENRFAMLFDEEEEEVTTSKKEVVKGGKGGHGHEKRQLIIEKACNSQYDRKSPS